MNSPDLASLANLFLGMEFQNPRGKGDRIGGKPGTGFEDSCVVGKI
jgi:hypothetical protein